MTLPAHALRATFDTAPSLTVGLEEEVFLLDPETLEPAPVASTVLARVEGDPRFKSELPAAQLELVTPPFATVPAAIAHLAEARLALLAAVDGEARPAAVAVPPLGDPLGRLNTGGRYDRILAEYGDVGRRQLVAALQVHVAVGGADATLAVYNALRSYLPEIAALAANGAMYAGRDSGFASVRPLIGENLPRQGVAPAIDSWESFAEDLRWGEASGTVPEPGMWWWELRPHVVHGTLEVRVPDVQQRIDDAAAVAGLVHALVAHLAEHAPQPPAPTWRIEENRWWAARDGVEGALADLTSGERVSTRERLESLIVELAPRADRLGCAAEVAGARELAAENGAMRQRAVVAAHGFDALVPWLTERWLA